MPAIVSLRRAHLRDTFPCFGKSILPCRYAPPLGFRAGGVAFEFALVGMPVVVPGVLVLLAYFLDHRGLGGEHHPHHRRCVEYRQAGDLTGSMTPSAARPRSLASQHRLARRYVRPQCRSPWHRPGHRRNIGDRSTLPEPTRGLPASAFQLAAVPAAPGSRHGTASLTRERTGYPHQPRADGDHCRPRLRDRSVRFAQ